MAGIVRRLPPHLFTLAERMKNHTIGFSIILSAILLGLFGGHYGIPVLFWILAPSELQLFVTDPDTVLKITVLFTLGVVGCFVLIAVTGYYCRLFSVFIRMALVVFSMLLGAAFGAIQVSSEFGYAVTVAEVFGATPSMGAEHAHFHLVPLLGLIAGSLAISIGYLLRKRVGQQNVGDNAIYAPGEER